MDQVETSDVKLMHSNSESATCSEFDNSWCYHLSAPKAGRKLKLLESEELVFALPLIYRLIPLTSISARREWFVDLPSEEQRSQLYISLSESLSVLNKKRKHSPSVAAELNDTNKLLNLYFSDYGWRMVRKELSQIKKRKKKSHIEISNDLVIRLKEYMAINQIDTFDQAIDSLLSDQASYAADMLE
ncbi:hypothetical protein [Shewanella pneumatophori]